MEISDKKVNAVSLAELTRCFLSIGLLSFGGPAAQIALLHRLVVEERRWIDEDHFLHALNFCMVLPGPEAQQLATYCGWLLRGVKGGLIAGLLFLLPGLAVILTLSSLYVLYHDSQLIAGLFFGLKAAVLVLVAEALRRLTKRAIKDRFGLSLAALSFIALFLLNLPFPLVILAAAAAGLIRDRLLHPVLAHEPGKENNGDRTSGMIGPAIRSTMIWGLVWMAPLILLGVVGAKGAYQDIFLFFARMALLTFGGAYAVLSYVAQVAVGHYHWLQPSEMIDGLALAETTPGPLVLVLSFVGHVAGFRDPGALPPLLAGLLGGLLAAWATFAPSFLWIFAGAPFIERLRDNRRLAAGLAAITAAVVGVILNLSLWFALHVLFRESATVIFGPVLVSLPVASSLDPVAVGLLLFAFLLHQRLGGRLVITLLGPAIAGMLLRLWLG